MDVKEHRFIYTLLLISMLHEVELLPEGNVSTIFPNTTNAPVRCQIFSKDEKVVADIKDAISSGTKLIKYHLKLDNSDHKWEGKNKSDAYKLLYWVRTTGRHGTGLLLLRHDYDILSLTTLELGVVTLDVRIQEHPVDCLQNTSLTDVETLLRELVMNDFQNKSITEAVEMAASENVCNLHVLNDSGTARYKYICCSRGANAYLTCHYLESDIWLTILMVSVTVLKILIALYSPRFVPQSLYRLRNFAKPFVHKIDPRELKVIRTRTPDLYKSQEANAKQITTISSKKLKHMPKFEDALSSLRPEAPYTLIIDKLLLRVKSDRLLPEDYAPVSLIKALYESFVRCEIRYRSSAEDCCKADVCSAVACTKKSCSWYRLLKEVMKVMVIFCLALPWLLRMYVYFEYEHEELNDRKTDADERNLEFYFPGSVTLYLTPIHVLFLAIYCLLIFESLTYGIIRKRAKERLQFVMRKCFSDMADGEKMYVFGWLVKNLLKPCTSFGGIGLCVGLVVIPLSVPLIFSLLAFYMVPTLNIACRLLAQFAVYLCPNVSCFSSCACSLRIRSALEFDVLSSMESLDKDRLIMKSPLKRAVQVMTIMLCLISLCSVVFLISELISFLVEVVVYTLMGLVLHASLTLTYVSLILLLFFYANDSFGTVTQTYLKFNETMHSVVAGLLKEEIEEEVRKSEEKQENLAFKMPLQDFTSNEAYEGQDNTVENKTSPKGVLSIEVEDGIPQWTTSHLLLFLTRKDQPMIPSRFFFDSCKMPYYNVPGDILLKYLYAFVEFGSIIIFLLFVLLVVLAFDDAYNVTATNKLLATVAGGFLPFMLKKFLIKAHSITEVDISDIHFKICLNEVVKSYKESWPIFDIELKSCEEFKPTAILVDNEVLTTERSEIVDLMIDISEETKKSERHESNYIDMY
ncbi:uncharacterized protein LOC128232206 isoform X2 [Mya arenaria]|nr:uncharacterized protein LOC128232206 isoform X2 [Mya arenaria]XP_052801581.1 uncharacterized protein LOC128232206 isoform X2 [Mya arenaria]XP_052801582.1 uncharacterized protein LOC128232206 isoform X2 [Mya arenaria]XP_052801583.1 uncharacterized protein LOC128232206 isoform X2 [Mya arenaria]